MYDRADVLLIFPPQTEARFFPYLSLPYLTGHLRRGGRNVHQADLNIALLHDALGYPELLDQAVQIQGDEGIGGWYRRAMADVVIQNIDGPGSISPTSMTARSRPPSGRPPIWGRRWNGCTAEWRHCWNGTGRALSVFLCPSSASSRPRCSSRRGLDG
jgi:hypothetical protein